MRDLNKTDKVLRKICMLLSLIGITARREKDEKREKDLET